MDEYIVFPNSPITEALLDIRAEYSREITLAELESFHNLIKEDFPEKQQRIQFTAGLKISQKGPEALQTSGVPDGYLFKSTIYNKIVQTRLDGFTFNKIKPYENWEKFRLEARKLWDLYFKMTTPSKITRIALRYINRIEIPLPIKDFKEYILGIPDVPPKLPQELSHFFIQCTIPSRAIGANAIITLTMEDPTNNKLPIIFDIDVFRNNIYINNEAKIWDDFEKLRIFKNDIFFNSITEKTKELFK
ncbi:MAG TPA: TIGR04255 family protein [Candidatus Brocadiaceae bacterium]